MSDGSPLLFVFRDGWPQRARDVAAGRAPAESHAFFELARRGLDVQAVDSSLPCNPALRAASLAWQRLYAIPRSGLGYRLDQARCVRDYLEDDRDRHVLATNDSLALPLLALKERRRLRNSVAYFSIGLCDAVQRGAVAPSLARRYARLAARAEVVFVFTPVELELFRSLAPVARVRLLPLGIDVDWWSQPAEVEPVPATVFSVGRDPARLFPTLVEALRGLDATTTIVGGLARLQGVHEEPGLVVRDDLPVADVRALLWHAAVVVIPSRRAAYGSGQTTALHAMAASKPVVMTDSGWARNAGLAAGVHFLDVPAEDAGAMRAAVADLLDSPERGEAIGRAARTAVVERFSVAAEADALLAALHVA